MNILIKKKVLIVENDINHAKLIKLMLETNSEIEADIFEANFNSLAYLACTEVTYFLAIISLDINDLETEKIVKLLVDRDVPLIFYVESFSKEIQKKILELNASDYIIKSGNQTLDYLLYAVNRLIKNLNIRILIVDDSKMIRSQLESILSKQLFQLYFADSGKDALQVTSDIQNLTLALVDYNMPGMDGVELTKRLRKRLKIDQMAIIGISSSTDPFTAIQFLKAGANDFINKPLVPEELNLRIRQNVEMLEALGRLRVTSITDHLTGLYNRRYFFDTAERLFENSRRGDIALSIGMLDIDHFKKINDTYGHEAGDKVLTVVSKILSANFRASDLVCRFGGEEFCVISTGGSSVEHTGAFERLRQRIEETSISYYEHTIKVTISIGIVTSMDNNLHESIKKADEFLYQAKHNGRNRIVSD